MSETLENYNYTGTLPENSQNQGFIVHELLPEQRIAQPIDVVLAGDQEIAAAAAANIQSGAVSISADETAQIKYGTVSFDKSDLAEKPAVVEALGTRAWLSPDEGAELGLSKLLGEEMNEQVYNMLLQSAVAELDTEYTYIPSYMLESENVKQVSQIFEVSNGRDGFRIINFSETLLEGVKLQKVMNAIRDMDDLTGGTSTEATQLITIMPENLPTWQNVGSENAVAAGATGVQARTTGMGVVMLNEKLLKLSSNETNDTFTVGGGDIGVTTFHELTHITELAGDIHERNPSEEFGWNFHRKDSGYASLAAPVFEGKTQNPSPYGQVEAGEDVAESAAAMHVGGEWNEALDEERRQAIIGMYATRHSGVEGPSYLRCNEIDLTQLSTKLGTHMKHASIKVNPQISFIASKAT